MAKVSANQMTSAALEPLNRGLAVTDKGSRAWQNFTTRMQTGGLRSVCRELSLHGAGCIRRGNVSSAFEPCRVQAYDRERSRPALFGASCDERYPNDCSMPGQFRPRGVTMRDCSTNRAGFDRVLMAVAATFLTVSATSALAAQSTAPRASAAELAIDAAIPRPEPANVPAADHRRLQDGLHCLNT